MLAARLSDPRALGSGAALVGLGCALLAVLGSLLTLRAASLVLRLGPGSNPNPKPDRNPNPNHSPSPHPSPNPDPNRDPDPKPDQVLCLGSVLSCLLCFALDTPLSSLHPASAAALRLAPALGRAAARAQLYTLSALLLFWSLSNLTVPNPNPQPQPQP